MALVISISIQKGGVGKSTTAINLGAGLGLRGYKTLLIDSDTQGSLTEFFGVSTEDTELPILGDWITGEKTFDEVVIKTEFENLSIIPSNIYLEESEKKLIPDPTATKPNPNTGPLCLSQKIKEIENQFDFILIDNKPSFSLLFINSLAAGDHVLIPVKLQKMSVDSLRRVHKTILEVQENIKPINILGVVGTFFQKNVIESEQCYNILEKNLGEKVFKTKIRANTDLGEMAWDHKPIQYLNKKCLGFLDYESLVDEFIDKLGVSKKESIKTGQGV